MEEKSSAEFRSFLQVRYTARPYMILGVECAMEYIITGYPYVSLEGQWKLISKPTYFYSAASWQKVDHEQNTRIGPYFIW